VLGFAVAPFMITTFTLAERISPADRSGTAMTLLAGVTGLGWAVGAAVAGQFADVSGQRGAFAVTFTAAVLALALAAASRRMLLAADRPRQDGLVEHARTASSA
jgi:MFS family permease